MWEPTRRYYHNYEGESLCGVSHGIAIGDTSSDAGMHLAVMASPGALGRRKREHSRVVPLGLLYPATKRKAS
jgi:hypothetical protein